jgi:hypothetical protein
MMDFEFETNAVGQWVLTLSGQRHVGVVAVRAFPVAAPDEAVSIVDDHGHELVWIAQLADLPETVRGRVRQALNEREFMPVIQKLHGVSSFATPSTWDIETDRGPTQLVLKGEEDIRRLSASVLLVTDTQGVQYLIRDLPQMDRHSRKLLDRFL